MILIVHGAIQNNNAYLLMFLVKELSVVAFKNGLWLNLGFISIEFVKKRN